MTKFELVNKVSNKLFYMDKEDVTKVIEAVMSEIKNEVAAGKAVTLRGFGTFEPVKRATKKARNIGTGEFVIVPAHYIPKFKPAAVFSYLVSKIHAGS